MSLIDRVRRTLQKHSLASPGTRVVVALSGGPDSMALLHLLRQVAEAGELQLVGVAHLNHQLRAAADADERFCATAAAGVALPFISERADVRAVASAERRSLEDAAHVIRMAFFERAVAALRADVIAVGHSQDDQAETFLLRLLRGAGSRGLGAMHPRHGVVIRPLLECSRLDLRALIEGAGLQTVHDASNDDLGIPRNRVRAELLPLLTDRFNPRVIKALAREADLARADQTCLQTLADEWAGRHVERRADGTWGIEAAALVELPLSLSRRVLHTALERAAGGRLVGFDVVERALAVAGGTESPFDGPGQRVQRSGGYVVLCSSPAGSTGRRGVVASSPVPAFSYRLSVPGEVSLPETGGVMSAEVLATAADVPHLSGTAAVVPMVLVTGGLAVRNRRPGDRLVPSTAGHRKVQDLLVDRKVPRAERDRIPIVTDAGGRIVWVAGHGVDQLFRVSDPAQAVVVLRLKGVGGSC